MERMREVVRRNRDKSPDSIAELLVAEAGRMKEEDIRACREMDIQCVVAGPGHRGGRTGRIRCFN